MRSTTTADTIVRIRYAATGAAARTAASATAAVYVIAGNYTAAAAAADADADAIIRIALSPISAQRRAVGGEQHLHAVIVAVCDKQQLPVG